MATGLQAQTNSRSIALRLLEGATATNSPPSGASAGIALTALDAFFSGNYAPPRCAVVVRSTAGSATMTVTVRLWGYYANAVWVPFGTGADTTKGTLNEGAAIGEGSVADTLTHTEILLFPALFDRVYAEVTAIGGTSTAVNVDLVFEVGQSQA